MVENTDISGKNSHSLDSELGASGIGGDYPQTTDEREESDMTVAESMFAAAEDSGAIQQPSHTDNDILEAAREANHSQGIMG